MSSFPAHPTHASNLLSFKSTRLGHQALNPTSTTLTHKSPSALLIDPNNHIQRTTALTNPQYQYHNQYHNHPTSCNQASHDSFHDNLPDNPIVDSHKMLLPHLDDPLAPQTAPTPTTFKPDPDLYPLIDLSSPVTTVLPTTTGATPISVNTTGTRISQTHANHSNSHSHHQTSTMPSHSHNTQPNVHNAPTTTAVTTTTTSATLPHHSHPSNPSWSPQPHAPDFGLSEMLDFRVVPPQLVSNTHVNTSTNINSNNNINTTTNGNINNTPITETTTTTTPTGSATATTPHFTTASTSSPPPPPVGVHSISGEENVLINSPRTSGTVASRDGDLSKPINALGPLCFAGFYLVTLTRTLVRNRMVPHEVRAAFLAQQLHFGFTVRDRRDGKWRHVHTVQIPYDALTTAGDWLRLKLGVTQPAYTFKHIKDALQKAVTDAWADAGWGRLVDTLSDNFPNVSPDNVNDALDSDAVSSRACGTPPAFFGRVNCHKDAPDIRRDVDGAISARECLRSVLDHLGLDVAGCNISIAKFRDEVFPLWKRHCAYVREHEHVDCCHFYNGGYFKKMMIHKHLYNVNGCTSSYHVKDLFEGLDEVIKVWNNPTGMCVREAKCAAGLRYNVDKSFQSGIRGYSKAKFLEAAPHKASEFLNLEKQLQDRVLRTIQYKMKKYPKCRPALRNAQTNCEVSTPRTPPDILKLTAMDNPQHHGQQHNHQPQHSQNNFRNNHHHQQQQHHFNQTVHNNQNSNNQNHHHSHQHQYQPNRQISHQQRQHQPQIPPSQPQAYRLSLPHAPNNSQYLSLPLPTVPHGSHLGIGSGLLDSPVTPCSPCSPGTRKRKRQERDMMMLPSTPREQKRKHAHLSLQRKLAAEQQVKQYLELLREDCQRLQSLYENVQRHGEDCNCRPHIDVVNDMDMGRYSNENHNHNHNHNPSSSQPQTHTQEQQAHASTTITTSAQGQASTQVQGQTTGHEQGGTQA